MPVEFKIGDHVSWNSEAGRVSGTIPLCGRASHGYRPSHARDLPRSAGHGAGAGRSRVSRPSERDRVGPPPPDGCGRPRCAPPPRRRPRRRAAQAWRHLRSAIWRRPAGVDPAYEKQAFTWGQAALGLQFHAEIRAGEIERWLIGHACALAGIAGLSLEQLRADTAQFGSTLARQGPFFLNEWLDHIDWPVQACNDPSAPRPLPRARRP